MKQVIRYIRDFYNKEFNWSYFILILCLVGLIIYLNYWHGLEAKYIARGDSWLKGFAGYYLLYLIPFASAFFLQHFFFKDHHFFRNRWFIAILLLAPAFFSFRVNFNFHESLIYDKWKGAALRFWLSSINWVFRVLVVLLPVAITWWLKDRNNQPFYGSKPLKSAKPYLMMLLVMVPLIALASTQKDFLHMYPRAQILNGLPAETFGQKAKYLIYELCYGFDFVSIEFFFRGFLILSLVRICGAQCIIPAAVFYCTIHLGKPMGEAISSFFGGLVLGIVSYNTSSIWGGLMVHLGTAWMMEAGGWIGNTLRS